MSGGAVRAPASVFGAQWENLTQVNFLAPGTGVNVRVEKESAPGSGVWAIVGVVQAINATDVYVNIAGYTQNASYRVRFERQGVPSNWTTFSTPTAALTFPAAPTSVNNILSGGTFSATVVPSEVLTLVRWQFCNAGTLAVLLEGTLTSGGSITTLGPFTTGNPAATLFRARHERFSGAGAWTSAWTQDTDTGGGILP
jgi:hypothetical protein